MSCTGQEPDPWDWAKQGWFPTKVPWAGRVTSLSGFNLKNWDTDSLFLTGSLCKRGVAVNGTGFS